MPSYMPLRSQFLDAGLVFGKSADFILFQRTGRMGERSFFSLFIVRERKNAELPGTKSAIRGRVSKASRKNVAIFNGLPLAKNAANCRIALNGFAEIHAIGKAASRSWLFVRYAYRFGQLADLPITQYDLHSRDIFALLCEVCLCCEDIQKAAGNLEHPDGICLECSRGS